MSAALTRLTRPTVAMAVVTAGLLLVSGCSDPETTPQAGAPGGATGAATDAAPGAGPEMLDDFADVQKDEAIAATVPASVRDSGMTVVMNVSSAPSKFFATDNFTIIGLNPDVARALGRVIGVDVKIQDVQFDGIIPGLQAKRYDLAVSSMAPSADRVQVLDMIEYASWGTSLAVKAGNPANVRVDTMCGKKIAVQQGSIQNTKRIPEHNAKCKSAGQPDIEQVVLPDQTAALLQLSTGRVDGVLADTPVLGWAAKQRPGSIELVDEIHKSPVAVALPKGSELTPAVQKGLQKLMGMPEYAQMFEKWGMSDAVLDKATKADGDS